MYLCVVVCRQPSYGYPGEHHCAVSRFERPPSNLQAPYHVIHIRGRQKQPCQLQDALHEPYV